MNGDHCSAQRYVIWMSSSSSRIRPRHRARLGCWMLIVIPRAAARKLWAKGEFPQHKKKMSKHFPEHFPSHLWAGTPLIKLATTHRCLQSVNLASKHSIPAEFDCWLIWTGQYGRDRRHGDVLARGQAVFDDVTRRRAQWWRWQCYVSVVNIWAGCLISEQV